LRGDASNGIPSFNLQIGRYLLALLLNLHKSEAGAHVLRAKHEMVSLIYIAATFITAGQFWVNPDCGFKTCHWEETKKALVEIVPAAKELHLSVQEPVSL
jgi:hypothetical protein